MHHGAAMCIGRKGLFNQYNENKKLIKEYKENMIKSKQYENKSSSNVASSSTSLGHSDKPVMNASVGTLL